MVREITHPTGGPCLVCHVEGDQGNSPNLTSP